METATLPTTRPQECSTRSGLTATVGNTKYHHSQPAGQAYEDITTFDRAVLHRMEISQQRRMRQCSPSAIHFMIQHHYDFPRAD